MSSEWSAGGVVVREHQNRWELAVIQPRGKTILCLPKGHIDPGETPQVAALREVREETGITARLESELGDIQYVYQFRGRTIRKRVSFFLLRYESGEIDSLDPTMRREVDRAQWIELAEAKVRLAYFGEREVVDRALSHLQRLEDMSPGPLPD